MAGAAHALCCATLALQLTATRGYTFSRETIRRTLHSLDYRWKPARHVARDDDPERVSKLARIRHLVETLPNDAALFFADELDIHLLAKLGYEWMLKGTQSEVMTPGTNQKRYLAGALNYLTGKMLHVVGERKDRWLFIDVLKTIERACPAAKFSKVYIVVDNYRIHTAKAVVEWLAQHPRIEYEVRRSLWQASSIMPHKRGLAQGLCIFHQSLQHILELCSRWSGRLR